eukprot:4568009-Prymnesium_polylepis.2
MLAGPFASLSSASGGGAAAFALSPPLALPSAPTSAEFEEFVQSLGASLGRLARRMSASMSFVVFVRLSRLTAAAAELWIPLACMAALRSCSRSNQRQRQMSARKKSPLEGGQAV